MARLDEYTDKFIPCFGVNYESIFKNILLFDCMTDEYWKYCQYWFDDESLLNEKINEFFVKSLNEIMWYDGDGYFEIKNGETELSFDIKNKSLDWIEIKKKK